MSLKAGADPGGGARGTQPPPQVFLAQTEAWRAPPKFFFVTAPPPLPPLSEGLDQPMQGSISVAMKNMDKAVL